MSAGNLDGGVGEVGGCRLRTVFPDTTSRLKLRLSSCLKEHLGEKKRTLGIRAQHLRTKSSQDFAPQDVVKTAKTGISGYPLMAPVFL